jgi:uncharacterized protein
MDYIFEWDPVKANTNKRKHKVSFELAATIFNDPLALTIFDEEHSKYEERWITLGIAGNSTLLVVVNTFREINENEILIRIISARKATKNEIKHYQCE